jgi:hypothetical protein
VTQVVTVLVENYLRPPEMCFGSGISQNLQLVLLMVVVSSAGMVGAKAAKDLPDTA